MSKYYTPDISEFHVGFEYEKKSTIGGLWKEHIIEYGIDARYKEIDIEGETVRVKYLDKEDIESLGFGEFQKAVCGWYKLEGKFADSFASYGYWTKIRLLHCTSNNVIKIIAYEYDWLEKGCVLYQGKCNNKSELKRLLKQLNINK